ncbi:hypothetical protein VIGAN_09101800, partial [Vigna angularis var. angularis]
IAHKFITANKNRKTKLEFKHYSKEDELNRNPPFSLCVAHFLYCPASVPFQLMVSSILCWTFSSTGFSTYQAPYTTLLYWKKTKTVGLCGTGILKSYPTGAVGTLEEKTSPTPSPPPPQKQVASRGCPKAVCPVFNKGGSTHKTLRCQVIHLHLWV